MGVKITGLSQLTRKLKDLERNARDLDGSQTVPMDQLLNDAFIKEHTKFSSLDDFLTASGFEINSTEDFEAIPDDQWDACVKKGTSFSNWQEMMESAAADWTRRKLGLE
jgi:hypothetical protein